MTRLAIVTAVAGSVLAMLAGEASGAAAPPAARCLRALVTMTEESVPRSADFVRVACPAGDGARAFRRDNSTGVTRLSRAIAAGETVPSYPEYGIDMIEPGQTLQLVVIMGAARIERQVEALQPARPGQRLFVRSDDGEVLSVRYRERAP